MHNFAFEIQKYSNGYAKNLHRCRAAGHGNRRRGKKHLRLHHGQRRKRRHHRQPAGLAGGRAAEGRRRRHGIFPGRHIPHNGRPGDGRGGEHLRHGVQPQQERARRRTHSLRRDARRAARVRPLGGEARGQARLRVLHTRQLAAPEELRHRGHAGDNNGPHAVGGHIDTPGQRQQHNRGRGHTRRHGHRRVHHQGRKQPRAQLRRLPQATSTGSDATCASRTRATCSADAAPGATATTAST